MSAQVLLNLFKGFGLFKLKCDCDKNMILGTCF